MKNTERNEGQVDVLFLPVSGSLGYGEVARCRIIARAVHDRWPQLAIKLALSREALRVEQDGLDVAFLSASPTRDVAGATTLLTESRPRLVIFDSGGRASLLRTARGLGAGTAFIASRPSSRRRAFSIRRMRHLDEAWLIGDPVSQPRDLKPSEHLFSRLVPNTRHQFMGPIFPEPRQEPNPAAERVGGDYALFVPGGGATGGSEIGRCFLAAAQRYVEATGHAAVVIFGPGSDLPAGEQAPYVIASLSPQLFVNALAGCTLAVIGGGSLVGQALALDKPVVAAALGGRDQHARVHDLAAYGALLAACASPDELATQAIRLRGDDSSAATCERARHALSLQPGLPRVLERIAELLGLPE